MDVEQDIRQAIQAEIAAQRRNLSRTTAHVESIQLLCPVENEYIYRLELSKRLRLLSDQPITLIHQEKGAFKKLRGRVLDIHNYTLTACMGEQLSSENLRLAELCFDPTYILSALENVLFKEEWLNYEFPRQIIQKKLPPVSMQHQSLIVDSLFNSKQREAIERGFNDPIHIIWGPPGTGKTKTLGQIVAQHLQKYRSCLLLSISNVAVDQLLSAVIDQVDPDDRDELVRYGVPQDRNLDIYTPQKRCLAQNPQFLERMEQLNEKQAELRTLL
ncbi:MAG: AAA family ATPase [Candidatus Babeliaceae bacterium]|nr:AAA family ATPase [Candidatus Babeliaceae bacterium]